MEISFSSAFKKAFRKRIKDNSSEAQFWQAVQLFTSDPLNLQLKTHKLSGSLKGLWSFSFGYDLSGVLLY